MPPSLQFLARCLLPAILFGLSACAGVPRQPPAPTPPPVPAATWESVDRELLLAARTARAHAAAYAEAGLDLWLGRVGRYTDETFVPWYTSYWTQEWLAVKFAWYQSDETKGETNGEADAERRLAAYLQEKYQAQVLEPASEVADPGRLLHQATALYLFTFAEQAAAIGRRYRLAEPVYREHLARIPAIPGGDGEVGLALGPLLAAARPDRLPPYATLLGQVERAGVDVNARLRQGGLVPAAHRVAGQFAGRLATRGGSAAAAAALGGPAGLVLSLGVTVWSANEHEKRKPALEAELQAILEPALARMRYTLLQDPKHGLLGAVNRIQGQVGQGLGVLPVEAPAPGQDEPW